jgi:hypothetical protein
MVCHCCKFEKLPSEGSIYVDLVVGSTWSLYNFGPLPHPDRAGNRNSLTATDDASGMKYRWSYNDRSAPQPSYPNDGGATSGVRILATN